MTPPGVRVARPVAVAREVLEHRQHPGVTQPPRIGAGVLGDLRRIGADDRSPITVSSGSVVTSTTGAKSMVMPRLAHA